MPAPDDLDLAPALEWAAEHVGPIAAVAELTGGWTSTMLAITPTAGHVVVLRLMTHEPWRSHGAELTRREHEVQGMLAASDVPAPRPIALDADGARTGHPAHLMTRLPGRVDIGRVDQDSLAGLAAALAEIHAVTPTRDVRDYQSWAWEAKYVVPAWARDPGPWLAAFDLLRTDPPAHEPCFLHRDFHLRNVLWDGGTVSGVVDWVETSMGPAWLDVAHCRTNLAIDHGEQIADRFVDSYVALTGLAPEPYVEVMDVVGFLPPPGKDCFISSTTGRRHLETRLRRALADVG